MGMRVKYYSPQLSYKGNVPSVSLISNIDLLINSFIQKYCSSYLHMLGTIPGAGNTAMNKTDQKFSLHGAHILVDGILHHYISPSKWPIDVSKKP